MAKAKKKDDKKSVKKNTKNTRIPVSGHRDVLTAKGKDKGFVYRWVNDVDGRIETFKAGGYETVSSPDIEIGALGVDNASTIGGTVSKNVGQGVTAYLMKIKEEYFKEDQVAKAVGVDAKEETLNEHIRGLSGRYGGIEIKR